jgi:TP901 family phage tail tape measure protein
MAGASAVRGGQVFVEIGGDPRKLFAALNKIGKDISSVGSKMAGLGTKMAGVGAALAAPIALATRQFASFDDAIRMTAAVSGASGAELQALNDTARRLGATTSFTAVQVASLMTELGRAGFKPDEINTMTAAVLDLARATGTDATLASGIMAATLRQFSLGAEDATLAADVLTMTANSTFNTVESLGEALKYAGPVAKSLGLSLEDTAAILGVLGNVGIQGSEAGTALRRLSVISAGAGEKLQELFGVSNTDAAGNLKPLVSILDEIAQVTATMPVAERTKRMAEAFGLLGITSANVLSQTAGGVTDLAGRLQHAEGTAARAAKAMDAGLGGSVRITLSAIEGTALAIGDALAPSLQKMIDFIGQAATALTRFVKENQELVLAVVKGIAVFTAAGLAILAIGTAMSIVGGVLATVAAVLGAIMTPVGAIVVAIAAVGAGVLYASDAFGGFGSTASKTLSGIYDALVGGDLSGAMEILWAGLEAVWLSGIEKLLTAWHTAVGVMKKTFATIGSAWDAYVTKPISLFGARVAEASQERAVLGSFDTTQGTIFDNDSKKAARGRQKVAENLLASTTADGFEANKEAARAQIQSLQSTVDAGAAPGATDEERKAGEAALKEINAYREAISLVKARFAQVGIKTVAERQAALDKATAEIDAATKDAISQGFGAEDAQNRLDSLTRGSAQRRVLRAQADTTLSAVEGASTMEDLRAAADEFHALAATGQLAADQIERFEQAADSASERLESTAEGGGVVGTRPTDTEAMGRAAAAAATKQSEVAGTFSSAAIGGMGFGSNLAQQQLDSLKQIEKNTSDMGDDGVIG